MCERVAPALDGRLRDDPRGCSSFAWSSPKYSSRSANRMECADRGRSWVADLGRRSADLLPALTGRLCAELEGDGGGTRLLRSGMPLKSPSQSSESLSSATATAPVTGSRLGSAEPSLCSPTAVGLASVGAWLGSAESSQSNALWPSSATTK